MHAFCTCRLCMLGHYSCILCLHIMHACILCMHAYYACILGMHSMHACMSGRVFDRGEILISSSVQKASALSHEPNLSLQFRHRSQITLASMTAKIRFALEYLNPNMRDVVIPDIREQTNGKNMILTSQGRKKLDVDVSGSKNAQKNQL